MFGNLVKVAGVPVLAAALLVGATATTQAAGMATGAEIKAALSGNTLQGSGSKTAYSEYYDPDGTIRGKGYTGKWAVRDNQGCMAYGEADFKCWTAYIDGTAAIWYMDGKVDAAGMSLPGNPNNY